jgi:hypothetical protein
MRCWLVLGLVAACGRVGFDATATSGDAGDAQPGDPLQLAYPARGIIAVVDVTAVSLVPTVSAPAQFSIAPALPAGLSIDASSGAITGVPTQSADASYVVTAIAGTSTATARVGIQALPGYVVDSMLDLPDTNGGTDAICMASDGTCTLRAALETANTRGSPQLVLLSAGVYTIGSALPAIANDIEIAGDDWTATSIIAASLHPPYAALTLPGPNTLTLRDLGIDNFGGSDGGALAVTAGVLDVDLCRFTNNASPTSGGVLFINGGARATFDHSLFTLNASLGGNGGGWGGVIDGEGAGTTIVVRQSTAMQNSTAWGSFSHITTGTTLLLENSTLYNNTSNTAGTLATPGGIYTLVNDTIVGNHNTSTDSAGIYLYSTPCHYTVTNTIVAFNDNTNGEADCNIRDVSTTITSGGSNLLGDAGGNCASYFTGGGDHLSTDPGVVSGTPTDHGGATPTIPLAPGSPAVGAGQASACPAVDQRDLPRPMNAACDVGAVQITGS